MPSAYWIALPIGGIIAGIGLVAALCLPVGREILGGLTSILGFLLSAWSIGRLISEYGSGSTPALAIGLGFAALLGGYSLASAMLPQFAPREHVEAITQTNGERTAVLVLSDAETEQYSPSIAAGELAAFQDDGVISLGIVSTPFLFTAEKARYRAIGGISPARRQVRELAEALERALEGLGVDHCGIAWCAGNGTLRDQVDDLARAGYARVVVVPLGVGESLSMVRAKSLLDRARPDAAGVQIVYGCPLHGADEVAALLARRISIGLDEPEATGVALLAHGQPEARAEINPSYDEDESTFVNRIKTLVAEKDVPFANVRLTWLDWREPDVTSSVRHLAALGCTRILICPTCDVVDSIGTLLDIPLAIRQARADGVVSVITLSPWRDEPEVVRALRARAVEALSEVVEPTLVVD